MVDESLDFQSHHYAFTMVNLGVIEPIWTLNKNKTIINNDKDDIK